MNRKIIIKYFTPFIWRHRPERKANTLLEFATIEKDSGNQILWALELIPDSAIKALIFQHVLEEYFHADLFEGLSELYSENFLVKEVKEREILVDKHSTEKSIIEFFAYAHVGEDGVNRDFSHYATVKGIDSKISSIFRKVSEDENNHIGGTSDILLSLVKKNKLTYRWYVAKSKVKRNVKHLQRYTSHLGSALLIFSLALIYFMFGFLTYKKIKQRFISYTSNDIVDLINDHQNEISST